MLNLHVYKYVMKVRKATIEDCPGMLQLIREIAEYEKAPEEVTVDPKHFEESGFGEKPVWWAFVVENVEAVEEVEVVEDSLSIQPPSTSLNLSQQFVFLQPLKPLQHLLIESKGLPIKEAFVA